MSRRNEYRRYYLSFCFMICFWGLIHYFYGWNVACLAFVIITILCIIICRNWDYICEKIPRIERHFTIYLALRSVRNIGCGGIALYGILAIYYLIKNAFSYFVG